MILRSILLYGLLTLTVSAAVWFDDSDDYISIPDNPTNRPYTQDWSISLWFDSPDANIQSTLIGKRQTVAPFNQMAIYLGDNTASVNPGRRVVIIMYEGASWSWWYATQNNIVDGKWHHVLFRRNQTSANLWIDGQLQTLVAINDTMNLPRSIYNTYPWEIGRNGASNVHGGHITEVAMWNKYLSESEIRPLAAALVNGIPLQIQPGNLMAYWPLDDLPNGARGDGTTFRDLSGKGFHGTGNDGEGNSGLLGRPENMLSYP